MTQNKNKVRAKEIRKKSHKNLYLLLGSITILLLAGAIVFVLNGFPESSSYLNNQPLEVTAEGNRQIIRVPAGGNLQEAVNRAKGGDIIELQAGATYYNLKLPNKNISEFITIQSTGIKSLSADQIIKPSQANQMAKIATRGKGEPALSAELKSHHFRFIGIEFTPVNGEYIYNLVDLGTDAKKPADVPGNFEFDRCYFHSIEAGVTRRGIALNGTDTVIKNSYFEGFAFPEQETQAICGWNGTKNIKITNNYIEGGAENIMFGGADPASADLIPSDIEITENHLNKPAGWKNKNSIKCLFELKNAKRVKFEKNYLENNWIGSALRITVRNQDGSAPFSTIEDVTIKDNIINGAGEGINVLGKDDVHPSQTLKRLTINNNLLLNIGGQNYEGGGYFVQINDGENISITNNTVFNKGNIATIYGKMPAAFLFRDNIVGYGNYGIHSENGITARDWQDYFINNVVINLNNASPNDIWLPRNNFTVQTMQRVGFTNPAGNDFRLSADSSFKGKGKDKNDIGSSLIFKKTLSFSFLL